MSSKSANESALYMFHDVHAPIAFMAGRMISLAIAMVSAPMYCVFAVIVFKALRKSTKGVDDQKRLLLGCLLGNLISSALCQGLWNIGLNEFRGYGVEFCNYWARLGGL
jgi:hypothetical protein